MDRREFIKILGTGILAGSFVPARVLAQIGKMPSGIGPDPHDKYVKDYLHKMEYFNKPHPDDIYLDHKSFLLLKSCVKRFKRLQSTVGHGNFYLLSFDDAIKIARNYRRVGRFKKKEIDFLEMIFYKDPSVYGFYGEKPLKNITSRIQRKKVVKIKNTGNYLYTGLPLETYRKIKKHLGDQVVLTSGVRSIIKQFLLFLNRVYESKGNLSLASRSLAPPGYSYHGISDFDVGQVGFGEANFTERFITTGVYKRLEELGYLKLRYPNDNLLGVRFEPWHIKVV